MKKLYTALLCSTMLFGITGANAADSMSKDSMSKDKMGKMSHTCKDGMQKNCMKKDSI